jgi:hypothetical protein
MSLQNRYTVLIVGDHKVGKTFLVDRLFQGVNEHSYIPPYEPTIEDICTYHFAQGEIIEIIETSPMLPKRDVQHSMRRADAIIIAYDHQNFNSISMLFEYFADLKKVYPDNPLPPCIIADIVKGSNHDIDQSPVEEVELFAKENCLLHMVVRLDSMVSVRYIFDKCVELIEMNMLHYDTIPQESKMCCHII